MRIGFSRLAGTGLALAAALVLATGPASADWVDESDDYEGVVWIEDTTGSAKLLFICDYDLEDLWFELEIERPHDDRSAASGSISIVIDGSGSERVHSVDLYRSPETGSVLAISVSDDSRIDNLVDAVAFARESFAVTALGQTYTFAAAGARRAINDSVFPC